MNKLLQGWTLFQITWLSIFTIINISLFFIWDDTVIGLISSLTGMICVVQAARGKLSNYYFGLVNTVTYAYIALGNAFYGEVMLYILFYLPIQFIGFYMWKKNMNHYTNEVKAKKMSKKQMVMLFIVFIASMIGYSYFLVMIDSNFAILDASIVILSIIAQILMIKRYTEQWLLWIMVNIASITLWASAFISDGNDVTLLVMYSAFFFNSLYGYIKWNKAAKMA